MIAVALDTRNQNLFIETVVLLIAYFLALLIVIANSVASRFENESSGESGVGPTHDPARPGARADEMSTDGQPAPRPARVGVTG